MKFEDLICDECGKFSYTIFVVEYEKFCPNCYKNWENNYKKFYSVNEE